MARPNPVLLLFLAAFVVAATARAETPVERGRHLVEGLAACGNCHTPKGPDGPLPGMHLAGGFVIDDGPFIAVASNITPDPETGIGSWTDDQLVKAIREGIRPDGSVIGPPMPIELYRHLADDDVRAMVAYLRSVPAVRNKPEKSVYRMPLPPNYGPPVGRVEAPPRTDTVAWGSYLANAVAHCTECHTPMGEGGRRDYTDRIGAGGFPFKGPWGISVSANITPDRETGLGEWTDAEIARAITTGVSRDGRKLFPPMDFASYAAADEEEIAAIVAYLRTLKPQKMP